MLPDDIPARIVKVTVAKVDNNMGSVNLAEDVRVKTIKEASKFADIDSPKTLNIVIKSFHVKNAVRSLLIGDANRLTAGATLVDQRSGKVEGRFNFGVVTATELNGVSGMILAGFDTPLAVEQRLATRLSKEVMVRVYGSERALAVLNQPARVQPKTRYPADYAALERAYECKMAKSRHEDPNDVIGEMKRSVPAHCK